MFREEKPMKKILSILLTGTLLIGLNAIPYKAITVNHDRGWERQVEVKKRKK